MSTVGLALAGQFRNHCRDETTAKKVRVSDILLEWTRVAAHGMTRRGKVRLRTDKEFLAGLYKVFLAPHVENIPNCPP